MGQGFGGYLRLHGVAPRPPLVAQPAGRLAELCYLHDPAGLLDWFALMQPALVNTGRIPGNKGIWAGISAEFVEFTMMFVIYFFARLHHPEAFKLGPIAIWTTAGVVNTVLMVTSSYFIACAVSAMRAGNTQRSQRWMIAAIITALGYPFMKFQEIVYGVLLHHPQSPDPRVLGNTGHVLGVGTHEDECIFSRAT